MKATICPTPIIPSLMPADIAALTALVLNGRAAQLLPYWNVLYLLLSGRRGKRPYGSCAFVGDFIATNRELGEKFMKIRSMALGTAALIIAAGAFVAGNAARAADTGTTSAGTASTSGASPTMETQHKAMPKEESSETPAQEKSEQKASAMEESKETPAEEAKEHHRHHHHRRHHHHHHHHHMGTSSSGASGGSNTNTTPPPPPPSENKPHS